MCASRGAWLCGGGGLEGFPPRGVFVKRGDFAARLREGFRGRLRDDGDKRRSHFQLHGKDVAGGFLFARMPTLGFQRDERDEIKFRLVKSAARSIRKMRVTREPRDEPI